MSGLYSVASYANSFLYSEILISCTLNFSNLPLTQTKVASVPWVCYTVILLPIAQTTDFSNHFLLHWRFEKLGLHWTPGCIPCEFHTEDIPEYSKIDAKQPRSMKPKI